ncbi:hypothetical protein GZH47_32345 (plasmid) [Paenibacillus rhizovicinus]|uniref:Uncharacterized protein n=1 Tax=Paenibacillus rhizovicinus TaxID=2704463 RepID=A0A6C0PAK6_9BACL|nr:hypothetical protein [Paenibacillus rhizovicinus]QHW35577.1 hypothetical protein GZH47_32345 [Paenibacillus rhizovicinus]
MATAAGYKAIIHYYLQKKCWSIHMKSCCYQGHFVIVDGFWGTEVKPSRKSNPRGWVTARSHQILFFTVEESDLPENQDALSDAQQRLGERLRYDKEHMTFNVDRGTGGLFFSPKGAFTLLPKPTANVDLFSFFTSQEVG